MVGEGKNCGYDVCHDMKPHNSFIFLAAGSPFPDYSSGRRAGWRLERHCREERMGSGM